MELTRLSIRNRAVKQIIGYCSLRAQKKDCNEYHQLEDIATWAWLPSTMTAQDFCSKEIQYRAGAYVRKSKFRICWIDIQMMNGRSRRGVLNTSLPLGAHVVVVVSNDQIDSFCFILSYLR